MNVLFLRLKKLSIRQAVRLNTIFYTSLFFTMTLLFAVSLYNLQSDRVEEKIERGGKTPRADGEHSARRPDRRFGRLHECRQEHADAVVDRCGRVCRRSIVRDTRYAHETLVAAALGRADWLG